MGVYWLMFLMPFLGSIRSYNVGYDIKFIFNLFFIVFFSILIGFRYKVGGDWDSYAYMQATYDIYQVREINFLHNDFLYFILLALSNQLNLDVWFPNLICGLILVTGVVAFCNQQRHYYLALLVCVPYLFIVVGMGYSRQAAAIGFIFFALSVLHNRKVFLFLLFIFFGSLFHKSCLIVVPFGLLAISGNKRIFIFLGSLFLVLGIVTYSQISEAVQNYIGDQANESRGALIRIILSVIPSALILRYHKLLLKDINAKAFWRYFSLVPLFALPLVPFASNLTDRLLLYSIPIQAFCFSRLDLLFDDYVNRQLINFLVVLIYCSVLFIWINFGAHSSYWIPYRSFLFSATEIE